MLLKRARTLLSQADEMAEEVHRLAHGPSSRLRIGFVNSTLHSVLPPVMQEFSHKYPDVELVLSELPTEVQIQRLQSGAIDIGLLRLSRGEDHALRTAMVWREPLVVVLPVTHALARRRLIQLRELRDDTFVTYSRQAVPRLREQIVRSCERAGFTPSISQEVRRASTVISLVAAGFGIGLVPATAAGAAPPGVRFARIAAAGIYVDVYVAVGRGESSPAAEAFFAMAKALASRQVHSLNSTGTDRSRMSSGRSRSAAQAA